MLPEKVKSYLLYDLEATPALLDQLLGGETEAAVYDRRPDPVRFTLREALAHMADWEAVFLKRLQQTRDDDRPPLVGLDEGHLAIERDYAHADPAECRVRFRQGRQENLTFLRALTPDQWDRVGVHSEVGPLTATDQIVMIASHGGYHLKQILQWLDA